MILGSIPANTDMRDALAAVRLLYANTTVPAGNTVANTATETGFASSFTIPANTLKVGDLIEVELWGYYSTALVATTIIGKIKAGTTVLSETLAVSAVAGVTNGGWLGVGRYLVTAIGASGSIWPNAWLELQSAATTGLSVNVPGLAAVTVDTTVSMTISVTVQWSAASVSNTITLTAMPIKLSRVGT